MGERKATTRKKVLIAYKFMPQYRIDFFNRLKDQLDQDGIDLEIVYGRSAHSNRNDEKRLDWAIYRKNRIFGLRGVSFYWQPITDLIKGKDLVIVEQANALLINYYLMLKRSLSKTKLAFWGHGRNRQGNEKSLSNRFKKRLINKCDHWFAYTGSVESYLLEQGFPANKISVVNNSFDTRKLKLELESISETEKERLREELGITPDNDVTIYCGALYKEKRLDFLLEAATKIRRENPQFKLIIIGSGDDVDAVEQFTRRNNWSYYVGAQFDRNKALYFSISKLFLMPGAVGLAVLDSFALAVPMVLCSIDIHGPEVDYLVDNHNCIFSEDNTDDFALRTLDALSDDLRLQQLKEKCSAGIEEINLENMLAKFVIGIKKCLYDKVD